MHKTIRRIYSQIKKKKNHKLHKNKSIKVNRTSLIKILFILETVQRKYPI
jgi:hypothetical protein